MEKCMSEAELARRLGWTKQYLNKISCGKDNPTIEQLERIAESLGMTLHISHRPPGASHRRISLHRLKPFLWPIHKKLPKNLASFKNCSYLCHG